MKFSQTYTFGSLFGTDETILFPNAIKLSPLNGGQNLEMWYIQHPMPHTSTLKSYGFCLTCSGLRYKGVPILVARYFMDPLTILETPRSPIYKFLKTQ